MGVHDVRLTGGEPLVRRDFPRLAEMLAGVDGVDDLSVTTNGFLLERDAEALVRAGVNRFNVSIDSLQKDRFYELTRRDALPQVLRGLEVLAQFPEAHPIKINAVAIRDFTEEEVAPVRRVRAAHPLRGPLHRVHAAGRRPRVDRRPGAHRRRDPRRDRRRLPARARAARAHATARVYRFADGTGRIGFINPVSEPFCGDCNRIRLTADGRLRTCLFSLNETDLRGPLRDGADDAELEEIIRAAVWRKELKHHVGEPGFIQPARTCPPSAVNGSQGLRRHHRRHQMLLLMLFAFIAGAGTAITPCVLPVLPALLSASAVGGRRRPLGIVIGLAATFTIAIVALAQLVNGVGLASGARGLSRSSC